MCNLPEASRSTVNGPPDMASEQLSSNGKNLSGMMDMKLRRSLF